MNIAPAVKKRKQDLPESARKKKPMVKTEEKSIPQTSGHRPVTSCTHCRQHKIKCNASDNYPNPCQRCDRMGLNCEIDPQFRPKKGSQIQTLRNDVDELKAKLELLHRNGNLLSLLSENRPNLDQSVKMTRSQSETGRVPQPTPGHVSYPPIIAKTYLQGPELLKTPSMERSLSQQSQQEKSRNSPGMASSPVSSHQDKAADVQEPRILKDLPQNEPLLSSSASPKPNIKEFILGDVHLPLAKANELHSRFINDYLPFLPILTTNSAIELYSQSQLLFWTVCLTACLSDPEPTLYNRLAALIKQLAIETCWIRTPRSTHIIQSLLILSCWPLPNQKVLDDCSYRFVGLAKSLSFQLGLHRGQFMREFSRTQVNLVNAEKWRTRTWLFVFFSEQLWTSILGLPSCLGTDFLIEQARVDESLPKNFRCLICLAVFQSKLATLSGASVSSLDGLMSGPDRAGTLHILSRELERLVDKLQIDDPITELYYLYVKLLVCGFAFLPDTPTEDQAKYVTVAYNAATRIVTIFSKLVELKQLSEYPIYVRHSVTFACFTLFRLHLTPLMLEKNVDSARQSIVTVHRLFRNMLAAWKDVDNDISRTATVLEKLNYVIITQPKIFFEGEGIIKRNRSHLANSLFYDLVYCIHEARRRNLAKEGGRGIDKRIDSLVVPLPFYNQITRDNFKTISSTSPNGTTVTTLVPTQSAMSMAQADAIANGLSGPTEIGGIPLALLEATGSAANGNNNTTNATKAESASTNAGKTLFGYKGKPVVYENGASELINGMRQPVQISQQQQQMNALAQSMVPQNQPQQSSAQSNNQAMPDDKNLVDLFGNFLQQQTNLTESNDDFLGWFDMAPEF